MKGIKHIEFWASNLKKSIDFYKQLFDIIGWKQVSENGFEVNGIKIYFRESKQPLRDGLGPRHICFWAESRKVIDEVSIFLIDNHIKIIRGPIEMKGKAYSLGYYTVDFHDPDGYIIEVAHTN